MNKFIYEIIGIAFATGMFLGSLIYTYSFDAVLIVGGAIGGIAFGFLYGKINRMK